MNRDVFSGIIAGVIRFQQDVYPHHRELFERLAKKQHPEVLFFTCADSRVDPTLITQCRPGQLFICRNIGNVVPPHGAPDSGVGTILEYAVDVLGIPHIVVCGHSDCGAMKSLLDPDDDDKVPHVTAWLRHAEAARRVAAAVHSEGSGKHVLQTVTEQNIIAQLNNLRTYPGVAAGLASGNLEVHGWYYEIGTGAMNMLDQVRGAFVPLGD